MSPLRRTLSIIGLIILASSLVVLALSLWPTERNTDRQTLPSDDLSLPTPQSSLPLFFMGAVLSPPSSRRAQKRKWILVAVTAGLLLTACGGGATTASPTEIGTSVATGEPIPTFVVEPTRVPTNVPQQTATALPMISPNPLPRPPESRAVELDYPLEIAVGSSDVIRLALVVTSAGTYLTPTAQSGNSVAIGEPVKIPNLYDTHTLIAVARLDAVGLKIDRAGDWEQPLLPGENAIWRWTVAADPSQTGRQRANLIIHLRFVPKAGGEISERELWARTIAIQTKTVLGLTSSTAAVLGVAGSVVGTLLGFPFADKFYSWLWNRIKTKVRKKKKDGVSN